MAAASPVKILFVGDLHLGRLPSRVPDGLADQWDLHTNELGPSAAWNRIIDTAVEQRVHCVALAGDLVHGETALFEASGILEDGVRRLDEAGITICAVAGNHDTRTLPRLADLISGFHLLGRDGTWSGLEIAGDQSHSVQIVGWSFPAPHHDLSPLTQRPPLAVAGVTTLGLLHCDLDAGKSRYAPVQTAELQGAGYQGWFLGHIHRPDPIPEDGRPFYLGSVVGLDPTETGQHGPVLVSIAGDGTVALQRLSLSPLRWENAQIRLDDFVGDGGELAGRVLVGIESIVNDLGDELADSLALGLRIQLAGTVANPARLRQICSGLDLSQLITRRDGTVVFVEQITTDLHSLIDLPVLARENTPPGILAQRIILLESAAARSTLDGGAAPIELKPLLQAARQELDRVDRLTPYAGLLDPDSSADNSALCLHLASLGRLALDRLLFEKGDDHASA